MLSLIKSGLKSDLNLSLLFFIWMVFERENFFRVKFFDSEGLFSSSLLLLLLLLLFSLLLLILSILLLLLLSSNFIVSLSFDFCGFSLSSLKLIFEILRENSFKFEFCGLLLFNSF
jgi:hypothetical protein